MTTLDNNNIPHSSSDGKFEEYAGTRPTGTLTAPERTAQNDELRRVDKIIEKIVYRYASTYGPRWSVEDREDAKTRIWLELTKSRGESISTITAEDHGALVSTIASAQLGRLQAGDYQITSKDRAGWGVLAKLVKERYEDGLDPEARAFDELAEEARMSFPERSRPAEGFHRMSNRMVELDEPIRIGEGLGVLGELIADKPEDRANSLGHGSAADWVARYDADQADKLVANRYTSADRTHKTAVDLRKERKLAWDLVAQAHDAPSAVWSSITADQRTRASKVVESEAGGVLALAKAWREGETTPEQDEALFAAFGDIDNSARERATDVLLRYPAYADELWSTALTCAAARPSRVAA